MSEWESIPDTRADRLLDKALELLDSGAPDGVLDEAFDAFFEQDARDELAQTLSGLTEALKKSDASTFDEILSDLERVIARWRTGGVQDHLRLSSLGSAKVKRHAALGKGWALFQVMAYWEWCEAAGEESASFAAIARMLVPPRDKDSRGYDPSGERKALTPFFTPLLGEYQPNRRRATGAAKVPGGEKVLLSRARLMTLLRKWRNAFERGQRIPDSLRSARPHGEVWTQALFEIGAQSEPSFDREDIARLGESFTKMWLLAAAPNAHLRRLSSRSIPRSPPEWCASESGLFRALESAGQLKQFLRDMDGSPVIGLNPPRPALLRVLVKDWERFPVLSGPDRKTSKCEEEWPVPDEDYWLFPAVSEAGRYSADLDCDAIWRALVDQASEIDSLPSEHPRRQLYTALVVRRRAMERLGAGGGDLHYWLGLLRDAPVSVR